MMQSQRRGSRMPVRGAPGPPDYRILAQSRACLLSLGQSCQHGFQQDQQVIGQGGQPCRQ
ncbi:MAG: hypothetical protein ACOYOU_04475 [Kiritimatiellia bacterium]